jgi:hypothetical protein
MNKTLMFLQADMHRAINDGRRSLDISVLDLKELLAAVAKAEGRETAERIGHPFAFIRPEKLQDLKGGKRMYCTIRLRKSEEFSEQIYCLPEGRPPIDAMAKHAENAQHQGDD